MGDKRTEDGNERSLSNEEILRYSRHLIMPEVGLDGQERLKAARVLLVGAGGLGSPVALYLAAAGVGTIGIVDYDVVDYTNLQRQIVHGTRDVGRSKLDSAIESMEDINPFVRVVRHECALDSSNAMGIAQDYDLVVDGTDNFPTRFLVNDVCVLLGKPNVYGSIFRFEGQATVFATKGGPCYRCLYPEPPPPGSVPSCAEGGVLGILPGVIGLIQATEAVKLILKVGEPLVGRLLLYDALGMRFRELKIQPDPNCPICGSNRTIHELIDYHEFCGVPGRGAVEEERDDEIDVFELKSKWDRGEEFVLLDVREPYEHRIANFPQAHLIPLDDLPARVHELSTSDEIVVHCLTGRRSADAVDFLRQVGFTKVKNLKGGIRDWAERIDPAMPRY